jgi:hypothetical protein
MFVKGQPILASNLEAMADVCRRSVAQPGQFQNGRLLLSHPSRGGGSTTTTTQATRAYALIFANIPAALISYDAGTRAIVCTPGAAPNAGILLEWNVDHTSMIEKLEGESPGEAVLRTVLWRGKDEGFRASAAEPIWVRCSLVPYDDGSSGSGESDSPLAILIDSEWDSRSGMGHVTANDQSFAKNAGSYGKWHDDFECEEDS